MKEQNNFQINEEQCKHFLEQQKQIAKAKAEALAKSAETLKEELELSDIDCADLLHKSELVKITCASISEPKMFVYNEDTQLWELKGSMPKVTKAIHTILKKMVDKKVKELDTILNSVSALKSEQTKTDKKGFNDMDKTLKDVKKAVKALGATKKLQDIFKVAGDCMCNEAEFNKRC